ncbi:hypothetical protein B566_EDAN018051 [Ephemera danica]|nr:hypothetical protein B566_EDAN018051 [Ephemera danica]
MSLTSIIRSSVQYLLLFCVGVANIFPCPHCKQKIDTSINPKKDVKTTSKKGNSKADEDATRKSPPVKRARVATISPANSLPDIFQPSQPPETSRELSTRQDSEDESFRESFLPFLPRIIPKFRYRTGNRQIEEEVDSLPDIIEPSQTPPLRRFQPNDAYESEEEEVEDIYANPQPGPSSAMDTGVKKKFQCPQCDKQFTDYSNMRRHVRKSCTPGTSDVTAKPDKKIQCPNCSMTFTEKKNLKRHLEKTCKKNHPNPSMEEVRRQVQDVDEDLGDGDVHIIEDAFNAYLTDYHLMNKGKETDIAKFFNIKSLQIIKILKRELNRKGSIKFSLQFEAIPQAGDGHTQLWGFSTENEILFQESDIEDVLERMFIYLLHRLENDMIKGSGWSLISLENIIVHLSKYEPLRGGTYIPLPKKLSDKRAIINPINTRDMECFKWCILTKKHPKENATSLHQLRTFENDFNWEGIEYPTSMKHIKIFEKNNSNVSINIYAIDEDDMIYPAKYSAPKEEHYDLLILEGNDFFHFTYIKNFSAVFRTQLTKSKNATHICKRCLTHHSTKAKLEKHHKFCVDKSLAAVVMPQTKSRMIDGVEIEIQPQISFNHPERAVKVPICVYADSEAILIPVKEQADANPAVSSTKKMQKHMPMSFCYLVSTTLEEDNMNGIPTTPQMLEGENPAKEFIGAMIEISKECKKIYEKNVKINKLTPAEELRQSSAVCCYMCEKEFTAHDISVRDHCHITGKYRGPAHNSCNILAQNPTFLPVYLHNNSRYDGHFMIQQLGEFKDIKVTALPLTSENLISFSIKPKDGIEIRFVDTFRFMSTSLESLANNFPSDKFVSVEKTFGTENLDLLRRKGVFCYDYINEPNRLNETELPPRTAFKSLLYEEECSQSDYEHAMKVWERLECKTLREYSIHYNILDVCILRDVFEAFRGVCLDAYHLDPCWYYTAPGLAWDAALRYTKINLDLIEDPEMLFMIEQGIRGGVAQVVKRRADANNPYLTPKTDKQDHIMYLDANNLYGWAMSQRLPTGGFEFVDVASSPHIDIPNLETMDLDGAKGYIFEVDVTYPEGLHNPHKDLPFLPEAALPPGGKHRKLLTTLYDKKNYIFHFRALKQVVQHGLIVTKIHKVLQFNQTAWLAPYIDLNTMMRTNAKNDFEKDFFKLMNNAVYGKTMENVRNRVNLEIVTEKPRLRKMIRSPFFQSRVIYNENLCAVRSQRKKVVMNKPIYVGMSILDISKVLMYEFHYDKMKPIFGDSLSLLYMDTDSYIYHITGQDFYRVMQDNLSEFDTSNYPEDHPCFSLENKKVIGKFKDECGGVPIEIFIGLRPKMYAYSYGGNECKRAKGVKTYAVTKKMELQHYETCLNSGEKLRITSRQIMSIKHNIFTVEQNKIALSSDDNKRYILANNVDTLPHGHMLLLALMKRFGHAVNYYVLHAAAINKDLGTARHDKSSDEPNS